MPDLNIYESDGLQKETFPYEVTLLLS